MSHHAREEEITNCSKCESVLPADRSGVLCVDLDGWGDRGIIDTFDTGPHKFVLCLACAMALLQEQLWTKPALRSLNINYGHVCEAQGDALVWTPLPSCTADPDQHGWREVFIVRPECTCGPNRNAYYAIADSLEEAEETARKVAAAGHAVQVNSSLLGNAASYRRSPALPF